MTTFKRLLILMVAVLAVACAAPTASPSPSAVPQSSPSSPPTPALTSTTSPPSAAITLRTADVGRMLEPGTYRVEAPFEAPFTMTLEAGWTMWNLEPGLVSIGQQVPDTGALSVVLVENVFADPCNPDGGPLDPPATPSVEGFVTALTSMAGWSAGPVTDVRIDDRAGKAFVTRDIDGVAGTCPSGAEPPLVTYRGSAGPLVSNPDIVNEMAIIDVDGTPVLIDTETFDATVDADRQESKRIVSSIAFD